MMIRSPAIHGASVVIRKIVKLAAVNRKSFVIVPIFEFIEINLILK